MTETIRVLLVDDDEDDFLITKANLSQVANQQYDLYWVSSGQAALDRLAETACLEQVALVDYRLGVESGLTVVGELARQYPHLPVILLTGMDSPEVDKEAMLLGATDFLVKGQVGPALLERAIRYAIEHKRVLYSLRQSERARELFYATLAHDLKTPIRAERRALEMLQSQQLGPITAGQATILSELLKSNRFQAHMVDNLLTAYRQQAAETPIQTEYTDLHQLLATLVQDELAVFIQDGHYQVCLELDHKVSEFYFDPFELGRVFRNLLQNAFNYTPAGTRIVITTRLAQEQVQVLIADNGPGLPVAKLDSLFEPFYGQGRRFKQVGTGLGLYLCKNIVEAHQGTLSASNRPECGCEFVITLPYRQTPPATEELMVRQAPAMI